MMTTFFNVIFTHITKKQVMQFYVYYYFYPSWAVGTDTNKLLWKKDECWKLKRTDRCRQNNIRIYQYYGQAEYPLKQCHEMVVEMRPSSGS
jgi:hypothetical protein